MRIDIGSEQTTDAQRRDRLVQSLCRARRDGRVLDPPDFRFDLSEAYAIQERVAACLDDAPSPGWKVGSTSPEAQARLGTDEPGASRLLRRYCFGDGDDVPVFAAHHLQVEVEFALRIGTAIAARPGGHDPASLRAAVAAFVPAMEVVGTRFRGGLSGIGREVITADGGANVAFIGGREQPLPDGADLAGHACSLHINGQRVATGSGARALGGPLNVLDWLLTHLAGRGLGLAAGEVVSTGTCTGLVAVAPGDHLCADFGSLGRLEARLVVATAPGQGDHRAGVG